MRRPENIRDIQADAMVISSLVSESNGGFNPTDRNWKVKRGLDGDDGWPTLTIVSISKRDFKSLFFP
jgi:hypothetical protein